MNSFHLHSPGTPPPPRAATRHSRPTFSLSTQYISPTSVLPLQAVHPALKNKQISTVDMAKLLLGDSTACSESTSEALSEDLILHRPRTASVASTASLDTLADVAQKELDFRSKIAISQVQQHRERTAWVLHMQQLHRLASTSPRNAVPLACGKPVPCACAKQPPNPTCSQSIRTEHDSRLNSQCGGKREVSTPLAFYLAPSDVSAYNKGGRIGIYSKPQREQLLKKFYQRRQQRIWHKKVRYSCRKNLANNRLRIKGRFVKAGSPEAQAHIATQA